MLEKAANIGFKNKYFLVSMLLILILVNSFSLGAFANEKVISLIKHGVESSKNAAQDSANNNKIPGYSDENKQATENRLGAIQANERGDNLRAAGIEECNKEVSQNPKGGFAVAKQATDISKVQNENCESCGDLHKHKMFEIADNHMRDPISQLEEIKKRGCKEKNNKNKKGFHRQENVETVTDTIEEVRVCEMPKLQKFRCARSLSVKCKKKVECDLGGIVKGKSKELFFNTDGGFFTIGTDADNNLGGICASHHLTASFEIAKKDLVTIFDLVHVKFDDYLELKLNGNIIYVGPDGGDFIEVKERPIQNRRGYIRKDKQVWNGQKWEKCERSENWNREVKVDLKPYLKDGLNTIDMKIIVSGGGEGWLKINAKQQCCANNDWEETWEEICE